MADLTIELDRLIASLFVSSLVVGFAYQGMLLVGYRLWQSMDSRRRHAVHQVTLIGVAVSIVFVTVAIQAATTPRLTDGAAANLPASASQLLLEFPAPFQVATTGAGSQPGLMQVASGIWLLGALLSIGLFVASCVRARRWISTATPMNPAELVSPGFLHHAAPCRFAVSQCVSQPMTAGVWPAVILVPAALLKVDSQAERDAVLAHEVAHIQRRDPIKQVLLQLTTIVFWFNPFLRAVVRHYANSREAMCDQRAVAMGAQPKALARGLARLALESAPTAQLAAVGPSGHLGVPGRIRQLLAPRVAGSCWTAMLATSLTAVLLGLLMSLASSSAASAYYDVHARNAYLESALDVDLDSLTYDVCALLSANKTPITTASEAASGTVTLRFESGLAVINGTIAPADLQPRLTEIFERHRVRRESGVYLTYRQADSILAVRQQGGTIGQTLGPGHWLNFSAKQP